MPHRRTIAFAIALALPTAPALAGPTLDGVRAKGHVQCGVSEGLPAAAPATGSLRSRP